MYKDVLRSMTEVEWFPIVSILIFFGFFMIVLYFSIKMKKPHVKYMSQLPLEEDHSDWDGLPAPSHNGKLYQQ